MHKHCGKRWYKFALLGVVGIAAATIAVMLLWNWLAPALFGWKHIGFLQALGLLVLTRILFGGHRGGPHFRGHRRWRMHERWKEMTPEEREKFGQKMSCCCGWGKSEESAAKE